MREWVEINNNESIEKEAVIFPGDSTVAIRDMCFCSDKRPVFESQLLTY